MNARAELPLHAPGTTTDRGFIGKSEPRARTRLVAMLNRAATTSRSPSEV